MGWETVEDATSPWAPVLAWETWRKLPGSWLQRGSATAIAAIWGRNQWMEDLFLSALPLPLLLPLK